MLMPARQDCQPKGLPTPAKSVLAIAQPTASTVHGFAGLPMDCFVPRDDQGGVDDALARHCEAHSAVAIHALVRPPMDRFAPRDDQGGRDDDLARHCEAHSAVAIHALVRPPMDRFVTRDDRPGRNDSTQAQ
jgi:hypothetical protein